MTPRVLAGSCGRCLAVREGSGAGPGLTVVMALDNPFFLDLGINGRRCSTCHEPESNGPLMETEPVTAPAVVGYSSGRLYR